MELKLSVKRCIISLFHGTLLRFIQKNALTIDSYDGEISNPNLFNELIVHTPKNTILPKKTLHCHFEKEKFALKKSYTFICLTVISHIKNSEGCYCKNVHKF